MTDGITIPQQIRERARDGLVASTRPLWFRSCSRNLLAADDALTQIDALVREDGCGRERDVVRLMQAAARAEVPRPALLAAFQEGLSVLASGGAVGGLIPAILQRAKAQGAPTAELREALRAEQTLMQKELAATEVKSIHLQAGSRLRSELPAELVDAHGLSPKAAMSIMQSAVRSQLRPPRPLILPGALARIGRSLGFGAVGAAGGTLAGLAAHFASLPTMKNPATLAEYAVAEAFLADVATRIDDQANIGTGVNTSVHVALTNHSQALWKPTAGEDDEKLRDQLEKGHQAQREAAAYIVDRFMGHFGSVPPTILRKIGNRKGALMWWVQGARIAEDSDRAGAISADPQSKQYRRMAVLDNVLGNLDRHKGNWMITDDEQVIPIDHGLCFPVRNRKQGDINYDFSETVPLDAESTAALRQLTDRRTEITRELTPLLSRRAIEAMFERVTTMLKLGRTYEEWRA